MTVTAGTLDDPVLGRAGQRDWVEKASPAAIFHHDAQRFHGQPQRQQQIDAFNALYGDA